MAYGKSGRGWMASTSCSEFAAQFLVNCAGLHCDRVARMAGEKPACRIVPFPGEYYKLRPSRQHFDANRWKKLSIRHIKGPLGVRGRNSDNRLIAEKLGWRPSRPLVEGLEKTCAWVSEQVAKDCAALKPEAVA